MKLRENIKNKLEETVVLKGFKDPLTEQYSHMYYIEWTDCDGNTSPHCTNHSVNQGGPCLGLCSSCCVCPQTGPCNPSTALTPVVGMEIGNYSSNGGGPIKVISYVSGPNSGGSGSFFRLHNPNQVCQSCDTTTASPCAQQWFQNPNATWASTWITNRDCSNYQWPSTHLENDANTIMAGAPNPQTGPYNNASDIWTAGQNSGLSNANQFIAKMAKAKYSQCQIQACNC